MTFFSLEYGSSISLAVALPGINNAERLENSITLSLGVCGGIYHRNNLNLRRLPLPFKEAYTENQSTEPASHRDRRFKDGNAAI